MHYIWTTSKQKRMKSFLLTAVVLVSGWAWAATAQRTVEPSTEEKDYVEKSVLAWADKTFEFYNGARFEQFKAAPSDAYFKLENQVESLKEYRDELKANFASGELKKTKEEVDKMVAKTDRKIDSLQTVMKTSNLKVSNYEVDFWANIMVNNGLTVYYQHHIVLDASYNVVDYKITGSIGKPDEETKILYKKK